MSNIKNAFEKGKAFIAFITCGDPDLETTARAVRAAAENGADLIELGIPFSDPTAEGSVIQGANLRALRMVQISSNLAYRSLILPQKVPSFRVQI